MIELIGIVIEQDESYPSDYLIYEIQNKCIWYWNVNDITLLSRNKDV